MASFNRAQYEELFQYALDNLIYHENKNRSRAVAAVRFMYMVEDCIGQQSDFPDYVREKYPRSKVGLGQEPSSAHG